MTGNFGPKNAKEAEIFAIEELIAETQYCIQSVMVDKKVSRSELARRLSCSAANVTQMLSENSNLTLETVAKVFYALEDRCKLSSEFLQQKAASTRLRKLRINSERMQKWFEQEQENIRSPKKPVPAHGATAAQVMQLAKQVAASRNISTKFENDNNKVSAENLIAA